MWDVHTTIIEEFEDNYDLMCCNTLVSVYII